MLDIGVQIAWWLAMGKIRTAVNRDNKSETLGAVRIILFAARKVMAAWL